MTIRLMELLEEMRRAINCNQKAISELKQSYTESTNCLVLKSQIRMTYEKMKMYHDNFEIQMKTGVVIVPHYFDVICVPSNTDLEVQDGKNAIRTWRYNMTNTNRDFEKGEKIHCKSWCDLRTTALILSSKGYGVAVIGFSDMSDDILTVTEVPEEKE